MVSFHCEYHLSSPEVSDLKYTEGFTQKKEEGMRNKRVKANSSLTLDIVCCIRSLIYALTKKDIFLSFSFGSPAMSVYMEKYN